MLNEMFLATATRFSGTTTPDKNGKLPLMLQCIAGTMPNRNVIAGTVAERAGIELGKTYLMSVRESGYDDNFGLDFQFNKVLEMKTGFDIVQATKELGAPVIQSIEKPSGFEESYERKGDAVEGQRSQRIKNGSYHPSTSASISSHRTARTVTEGSSINSGGVLVTEAYGPEDDLGELFEVPDYETVADGK